MSLRVAGIGVAVLVVVVLAILYAARPPTHVTSQVNPGVMIDCTAATGAGTDACLEWGDAIIERGPPSFTFEWDDMTRVEIDRSLFGLGSQCEVAYFISRYPDAASLTEKIPCESGR